MNQCKICVIVVNHKNHKLCYEMFKSIKVPDNQFIDFLVVDNSLDQNELFFLKAYESEFKNFKVLNLKNNSGYFPAINSGLSIIDNKNYDYIIVANNDLIFHDDFFNLLMKKSFNNRVYVICPDVILPNGSHQNPHVKNKFNFIKRIKLDLYYSNYFMALFLTLIKNIFFKNKIITKDNYPSEIHMGIGAIYILTRNFFIKNKTLMYPLFLYGEEAFLSKQVHDTSGILFYDPSLVVDHLESATLSKMPNRIKFFLNKKSYKLHRSYL